MDDARAEDEAPTRKSLRQAADKLGAVILRDWTDDLRALAPNMSFQRTDYVGGLRPSRNAKDSTTATTTLWLECAPLEGNTGMRLIHRVCEALALLKILSDLDVSIWKVVAGAVWPIFERRISSPPSVCDVMASPPLLGLFLQVESVEHIEWISERVVGVEPASPEYQEAFNAVKQALLASEEVVMKPYVHAPRIPVIVSVYMEDRPFAHLHRILRQLLQLAIVQHRHFSVIPISDEPVESVLDGSDERACMNIVGVDGASIKTTDLKGLGYFRRIADHDVRVLEVPVLEYEGETKVAFTKMLQDLLPQGRELHRQFFGVNEVDIVDFSSQSMMVPLLSAMQVCQSLNMVSITMKDARYFEPIERAHRTRLWRWIAYSLFSRDARHSIQDLDVDTRYLQATDVAEIQKVVQLDNPLEALFNGHFCHHHDYISASRFRFACSRDQYQLDFEMERHDFVSEAPIVVRVIKCASEAKNKWWTVLLPGRGTAWVHQDNVTVIPNQLPPAFPTFRSVTFRNLSDATKATCLAFLKALPCTIESVEFTNRDDYLDVDDWYPSVLTACPGLKQLIVPDCTGIDTLERFIDFAVDGTSSLEVLVVGSCVRFQFTGLIEFLEALADVTHPLAKSLCELELNIAADDFDKDEDEDGNTPPSIFVSAVQTMLDLNRRLHTITFVFEGFKDISEFEWYDEEIAIPTAPVALRNKLALLSALSHKNSTMGTAAVRLDSSVLTIIFQFAAPHRMRQIYTCT